MGLMKIIESVHYFQYTSHRGVRLFMKHLYQVMIVERQSQMVHVYKNMLPWEEYGFQIASVTDNEDKALAYYGEYKHHLVFTAVDLKSGNGISLLRKIKHLGTATNIIVISAHEDYDTVRDAFTAGADDYLLKSRLRYSSLATVLQQVKQRLDRKVVENEAIDDWETRLEKLLGLLRDQQKVNTKAIYELLQRPELSLLQQSYRMFYVRMDNVRIFNRNMKQYDKPSWMSTEEFINMFQNKLALRDEIQAKLKHIITNAFHDVPLFHIIFTKKHSALIIVPPFEKDILCERAIQLIRRIYEILTYEFSITISSLGTGVDSFLPLYKQAMEYHEHKFYDGDGCLEEVDVIKEYHHLHEFEAKDYERIVQHMELRQYDMLVPIGKHAISFMREHYIEPVEVKQYFCLMITKIEEMAKRKVFSQNYPFEILRQGIQECESIMYLDLEFEKILKTLIDWMKEYTIGKYAHSVALMMQYIQEHLQRKITLAMIAQEIGRSEIHASRIFKKETGQSIIAYVNEHKMQKAEELLHNHALKIKDVARMIGIEDQLYFNKMFKKQYHMSPRDYRKQLS